jgi:hypothetical protein
MTIGVQFLCGLSGDLDGFLLADELIGFASTGVVGGITHSPMMVLGC